MVERIKSKKIELYGEQGASDDGIMYSPKDQKIDQAGPW